MKADLVADFGRQHFLFGKSQILPERKVVARMAETINKLSAKQPLILVAHSASSEISYFKTLDVDTSNWQTGFPKIDAGRPAEEATNISLQDGMVYVIDTQQLFAASGLPGALPQTGLAKVLSAMQIPARRLHNAGNDAYCKQCTDPNIFMQADQYTSRHPCRVRGTGRHWRLKSRPR